MFLDYSISVFEVLLTPYNGKAFWAFLREARFINLFLDTPKLIHERLHDIR